MTILGVLTCAVQCRKKRHDGNVWPRGTLYCCKQTRCKRWRMQSKLNTNSVSVLHPASCTPSQVFFDWLKKRAAPTDIVGKCQPGPCSTLYSRCNFLQDCWILFQQVLVWRDSWCAVTWVQNTYGGHFIPDPLQWTLNAHRHKNYEDITWFLTLKKKSFYWKSISDRRT